MATTKRPSLIYEIQNFADTFLGKVTKFQAIIIIIYWAGGGRHPSANRVSHVLIMYTHCFIN